MISTTIAQMIEIASIGGALLLRGLTLGLLHALMGFAVDTLQLLLAALALPRVSIVRIVRLGARLPHFALAGRAASLPACVHGTALDGRHERGQRAEQREPADGVET